MLHSVSLKAQAKKTLGFATSLFWLIPTAVVVHSGPNGLSFDPVPKVVRGYHLIVRDNSVIHSGREEPKGHSSLPCVAASVSNEPISDKCGRGPPTRPSGMQVSVSQCLHFPRVRKRRICYHKPRYPNRIRQ